MFSEKILAVIRDRRAVYPDTRDNEGVIRGLKLALEVFMGSDEARLFLNANGEAT